MKKKLFLSIFIAFIFIIIIISFYTTHSLENNYSISSSIYNIEDNNIKNISPYTDISLFIDYFDTLNCDIKVTYNNKIINTGYVVNGSKTLLLNKNGQTIATYNNIIKGDYNSDGIVNEEDYNLFGEYLILNNNSNEVLSSYDINDNDEVNLNDLILLDKAISEEYQELYLDKSNIILQSNESIRVGYKITPNYGKNTNLKWESSNEDVAVVTNSGIITGKSEGEAVVSAWTIDGVLSSEVIVKVDNTIQLESLSDIIYVGDSKSIYIKSIDYNGITCESSNDEIVSCSIEDEYLVLTGNSDGDAIIVVKSPKYGEVKYSAKAFSTYVNLFPSYGCMPINKQASVVISTMLAGELIFDISDNDIIKETYVLKNRFYMVSGEKTGRGEVLVKATNGNGAKKFTLDVYKLSIPSIGGFGKVGEEIESDIIFEGNGELSCTSPNPEIATCRVDTLNKRYVLEND